MFQRERVFIIQSLESTRALALPKSRSEIQAAGTTKLESCDINFFTLPSCIMSATSYFLPSKFSPFVLHPFAHARSLATSKNVDCRFQYSPKLPVIFPAIVTDVFPTTWNPSQTPSLVLRSEKLPFVGRYSSANSHLASHSFSHP